MTDSAQPPRKKKRAKRKEPDFIIDPNNPNKTIELETADLLQLGQHGTINEIIRQRTRELQLAELEELRPGAAITDDKVIVDLGPDPDAPPKEQTVFVELGEQVEDPRAVAEAAGANVPARGSPTLPPAVAAPPTAGAAVRAMSPMNVQRVTPTMPRVEVPSRSSSELRAPRKSSGTWLVVLLYVLSASALALSIYDRFGT